MSSNVLLILNHNFVALPEAEQIVNTKKQEISQLHKGSNIDQFLLSNIVLDKVELKPNNYDFIYYLDQDGQNGSIPNHPSIKQSLRSSSAIPITKKSTNGSGLKNSKLSSLKFKRLNKPKVEIDEPMKSPSPTPSLPELSTPEVTEKKMRFFSEDSEESDDELINEDELIESSLNTSSIICLREPNSNGGKKRRKACKDCTCGLAEKEAFGFGNEEQEPIKPKVQFSAKELAEIDFTVEGKTGGCGSCSLGDAFRCSGCPFLGLPAFKPGQAITLDSIDDDL